MSAACKTQKRAVNPNGRSRGPKTRTPKNQHWKGLSLLMAVMMIVPYFSGCIDKTSTATAMITGHVTAHDGSSIPQVKVTNLQHETMTDGEGYYSLKGVSPGVNKLSLSKEGFVETTIVVEPVADETIDVGSIELYKEFEDVKKIEELTDEECMPGPDAENLIQYYASLGFENVGTIRVEHTSGIMNITALATSTSSAFVLEGNGAVGILFDFSEMTKEVCLGNIFLGAPFGPDAEEYILILQEPEQNPGGKEDYEILFRKKMKYLAGSWNEKLMDFVEGLGGLSLFTTALEQVDEMRVRNVFINAPLDRDRKDENKPQRPQWGDKKDEKDYLEIFYREKAKTVARSFNDKILGIYYEDILSPDGLRKIHGLLKIIALIKCDPYLSEVINGIHWAMEQTATIRWNDLVEEENRLNDELRYKEGEMKSMAEENEHWENIQSQYGAQIRIYYDKIADLQYKRQRLNPECVKEKKQVEEIDKSIESFRKEIENTMKQINEIQKTIDDNNTKIKDIEERIKDIKKRLEEIDQTLQVLDTLLSLLD